MDDYSDAYKKYFTEKLGLPVEEFDNILTSAKKPSAERLAKLDKMAKIAMEGGSMEEIASLTPDEQFAANQMRNKMYMEKSLAKKIPEYAKVAEEKLASDIQKNIAKAAPIETPYGKSFLSYTPEGKVAGMAGKVLRGAAKVAGPVGAAMTAGELGGALAELRKLGAEKIARKSASEEAERLSGKLKEETMNSPYTPEERLKLKEMLKKLKGNAVLRG